ncbi:MAG: peptide ABC transporter substrate-binding protein [Tissierellia bacterium]|nr:peptide ABC transporter substrate-binding protein [Tissierellia bacterium]
MNSNKFIYLCITVLLLVFLTACGTDVESILNTDNEEVELEYMIVDGGEVVLPLTPFNTLNPLLTSNLSYYYFSKLIFEGLFEFSENIEPVPQLAEAYNIVNDGSTILVKLREDAYWHDGEKFTSEDVFFTINVLLNSNVETAYNSLSNTTTNIANSRVIDDYNIEVNFSDSSSNNLDLLTFPIIASHKFAANNIKTSYSKALQLENYTPVGTGPFKFESFDKHKNISLKANENYRFGKPSIENVLGKVLDNEELFITAYEAGQINITPVRGTDWDKYKENPRIRALEYVSNDFDFLGFNYDNPIFSGENGVIIRKAINYAIDRQEIIQKTFLGHATQVDVPLHPNSYLLSEAANKYGYNPTASKELLDRANIFDRDGDGVIEDESGNKMSFRLTTNPSNLYRHRVAEMIRDDLMEIGIELVFDFNTSYERVKSLEQKNAEWDLLISKLKSGDYDIALLGWQLSFVPDLYSMYHSSQIGFNNFIKYNNANMDELLMEADLSYRREKKLSSYDKLQKYIVDELPYISLYFRNKAILIDNTIVGQLTPNVSNPYKGLESCIIVLKLD